MNTQPSTKIEVPILHCMYPDCGNDWVPRTDRKPKVCPRCKRYGWETGHTPRRKAKGGKKHVKRTAHLEPKTEQFLKQHRKET